MSKTKIEECYHWDWYWLSTVDKWGLPPHVITLKQISDKKCRCSYCGQEFPIEYIDEMRQLLDKAISKVIIVKPKFIAGWHMQPIINAILRKDIKPVKYRTKPGLTGFSRFMNHFDDFHDRH